MSEGEQQRLPGFDRSNLESAQGQAPLPGVSEYELNETQRGLVETVREAALTFAEDGKGIKALVTLYIGDRFAELFRLRNARNDAVVNYGDYDRTEELNEAIDDLLRELKRAGVPYHSTMGNRADWERLDVIRPTHGRAASVRTTS